MKKTLLIAVIASLVFGLASFSALAQEGEEATTTVANNGIKANAGEEMEKIPSPDQIRFFKNIEKKGISLYGIKKDKMIEKKEAIAENKLEKNLEKIAHPMFIELYEKIQRIGSALWGAKKENKGAEKKKISTIVRANNSACVISAIEVKDAALVVNNNSFTEKLNSAISGRTACQKTALASTEKQIANMEACIKVFNKTVKAVREETNKVHKEIWKAYQESLKVCVKNSAPADNIATSTESAAGISGEIEVEDSDSEEIVIEDGGGSITDVVASE